jgi:hypothetical protein
MSDKRRFVRSLVEDVNRLRPPGVPVLSIDDAGTIITVGGCGVGLRPVTESEVYNWWLQARTLGDIECLWDEEADQPAGHYH